MTDREWIAGFAQAIGVPAPDDEQFEAVLALAAVAAHASQRTAAPVACWLAGLAGRPLAELTAAAESVAESG